MFKSKRTTLYFLLLCIYFLLFFVRPVSWFVSESFGHFVQIFSICFFCFIALLIVYDFFKKGDFFSTPISFIYVGLCFLVLILLIIRRYNLYSDIRSLLYMGCTLLFVGQIPWSFKYRDGYIKAFVLFYEIVTFVIVLIMFIFYLFNISYNLENIFINFRGFDVLQGCTIGVATEDRLDFIVTPNNFAILANLLAFIAIVKMFYSKKPLIIIFHVFEFFIALSCVFFTQSRGGYYFLIISLIVLFIEQLFLFRKHLIPIYFIFICLFAVCCTFILRDPVMDLSLKLRTKILEKGNNGTALDDNIHLNFEIDPNYTDNTMTVIIPESNTAIMDLNKRDMKVDSTLSNRTVLWKDAIDIIKDNLLIGIGFIDNPNAKIDEYGGYISDDYVYGHTHNAVLQCILSYGLLFSLIITILVCYFFYKIIKYYLYSYDSKAFLCLPIIFAFVCWSMIESTVIYFNNVMSFLFFFIVGILVRFLFYCPQKIDSGFVSIIKYAKDFRIKVFYLIYNISAYLLPDTTRFIGYYLIDKKKISMHRLYLPIEKKDGEVPKTFKAAFFRDFSRNRIKKGNRYSKDASKNIYIDISRLNISNIKTGVQRREVNFLDYIEEDSTFSSKVYLVYYSFIDKKFKFVDSLKVQYPKLSEHDSNDVVFNTGDLILLSYWDIIGKNGLTKLKKHNVKIAFISDDIIPIDYPAFFYNPQVFTDAINCIIRNASFIYGVSNTTLNCLRRYIKTVYPSRLNKITFKCAYLGCDLEISKENKMHDNPMIANLKNKKYALSVGNLSDPRKGFDIAINSFYKVWDKYPDAYLVIVGRLFNHNKKLDMAIEKARKANCNLLVINDASDGLLSELYKHAALYYYCTAAEGFGIPLLEAIQYDLPVLTSDIPIFRELVGNEVYYFNLDDDYSTISDRVLDVFDLASKGEAHVPNRNNVKYYTWNEYSETLKNYLLNATNV